MLLYAAVASQVEFTLEVDLGHFRIAHCHADIIVAQQLHPRWKADAETDQVTPFATDFRPAAKRQARRPIAHGQLSAARFVRAGGNRRARDPARRF
jgi:hypothetical protein